MKTRVALVALVLLATACGQKAGVAGTELTAAEVEGSVGEQAGGPTTAGTAADGSGGAPGSGTTAATGPTETGTGSGAASATPAVAGGDRTGVGDTTLRIGLHAPLTGAAPVPTEAFRRGLPIYWSFIQDRDGGVYGRQVEVVFRDDKFDPSAAVRACQELVEKEKVFLLIGAAGADQISACAKYASRVGVPYLSAGVNESGLAELPGYFAFSQTYVQQSVPLAQLARKITSTGRIAIVIENTPSFRESKASIEQAAGEHGLDVVLSKFIAKSPSQAEVLTTVTQLRQSGADVVYVLLPPVTFISLAQQGQGQAYVPAWIGPGLSNGLNLVAAAACPGAANARFLSPFPQLDAIDGLDPDFRPAYRRYGGAEPDDLGIALWGLNKNLHLILLAAGQDLTREGAVAAIESGREFRSNVYPAARFAAGRPFGATTSHLLRADCSSRTFRTEATFASGF